MIPTIRSLRISAGLAAIATACWLPVGVVNAAGFAPSNMPLSNIDRALSNVVLTISAEFPTADTATYGTTGSASNPDTTVYSPSTKYYGYFDPSKCYTYSVTNKYFSPATCTATTPKGNFLNWASMTNIDQMRQVMTGGLRSIDTAGLTVLQRSYLDTLPGGGYSSFSGVSETTVVSTNINAPNRVATTTDAGNLGVVAGTAQSGQYIYKISGMGDKMLVKAGSTMSWGSASAPQRALDDCDTLQVAMGGSTPMCYHIRVKVCDSNAGLETNCVQYGSNYKPEGLMQQYNQNMRFAAFGYLSDNSKTQNQQGGVLRARMKSIGPTLADPINISTLNSAAEWDSSTGVFVTNPNPADATASSTLSGMTIGNSGVMNYLNKFGQYMATTCLNMPGACTGNTSGDSSAYKYGYAYKYYDPMAELYYDSLRYLKGLAYNTYAMSNATSSHPAGFDGFPAIPYGGSAVPADDPVTSACQQNFIILVGDMNNESCDTRVPGGAACSSGSLPTGDSVNYGTFGDTVLGLSGPGSSPANTADATAYGSSGNKYLGGMAYWAHTNDIRPDKAGGRPVGTIQNVTSFMIDVMEKIGGGSYDGTRKTQGWFAAKYGGFNLDLTDQTSASTKNNPNTFKSGSTTRAWDKDGNGIPDNWYRLNDPVTLRTGLTNIFQSILTATSLGDGAAPATSGVSVATATKIYYAGYKLVNGGTGSIKACGFNVGIVACDSNPDWDAAIWLDPTSSQPVVPGSYATYEDDTVRQIITRSYGGSGSSGVAFQLANLSTGEQALMNTNPTSKATDSLGGDRVAYLRGNSSKEIGKTGGVFRTRATTKLGDIVSSGTVYVGPPNALYYFTGYSDFVANNANRTPVLYAGANDGMLHAFDAATGKEVFAYIPNYFLKQDSTTTSARINSLTMPTYQHQFFVDATPMVGDVQISGAWTTMLVGAYGAGGKGFYALNITDPTKFSTSMNAESNASTISMWELSDSDDSDIGYTYNQPSLSPISGQALQFGLIPDGSGGTRWAVIVGNGFGSSSGNAVLLFLNPADGSELYKVTVDNSGSNGLATPLPIDTKGNGYIDTVWVGDLKGNMWRVSWDSGAKAWTSSQAFTGSSNQPITAAPAATPYDGTSWMVLFGTGKYLERTDYNSTAAQALYGIRDTFSSTPITITDLVQQTIVSTGAANSAGDFTRTTSSNGVDFTTKKGWYLNLPVPTGAAAERSIVNPAVPADTGVVLMSSFDPASSCMSGTGYVNVFNAFTGQAVAGLASWGGVGMNIPYFSTIVSSAGVAIVKVGGVRYGSSVTCPTCEPQTQYQISKTFNSGVRASWRELR